MVSRKYTIFLILMTMQVSLCSNLSGFIYNQNGTPMKNANILIESQKIKVGVISNESGYYIIEDLLSDTYTITISYIGFLEISKSIAITSDISMNFSLIESLIDFNQIVITGTKHKKFIKDTPVLTHIINERSIRYAPYATVKGIMEYVLPNVQLIHGEHGSGANRLKIQGLDNKYTAFLIDGVRVSGEFAGNLDFSMLDLNNVERIEFVNGAMSTLYGSSAMGGVINVITKKINKPYFGRFSLLYDYPLVKSNLYNFGMNIGKIYYNLAIVEKFSPGYNLPINDPTPDSNTLEPYESKSYEHRLSYNFNQSTYIDMKLKLYSSYIKKTTEDSGQGETKAAEQSKYADSTLTIQFVKDFKNGSHFKLSRNLEEYKKKYYYPYYYSDNWLIEEGEEFVNGKHKREDQSITYSIPFDNYHMIFGVDQINESYSSYNIYDFHEINNENFVIDNQCEIYTNFIGQDFEECLSESIFGGRDTTIHRTETSYYVYSELDLKEDSELAFGLRSTNHTHYDNKILFSSSYLYKINNNYNLRVSYGDGYRVPSIKELYYKMLDHDPHVYGSADLKASESSYYSISIDKYDKNEFSLNIYLNKIKNMISTQLENDILYYGNYDNVTIKGFNMHYSRQIFPKILLKFVYNYSYPESNSNEILEGISKHSFRIQQLFNVSDKHALNLNLKYSGSKYNYNQIEEEYVKLKSFWITDLLWSYKEDKFGITCGIKNMFNYKDKNRIDSDILTTYNPGRRIYFNLSFSY